MTIHMIGDSHALTFSNKYQGYDVSIMAIPPQGYEDWDLNNRIRQDGFRVIIDPSSKVFHKGMQTRIRRDTTAEQIHNSEVYLAKWKTREERITFG